MPSNASYKFVQTTWHVSWRTNFWWKKEPKVNENTKFYDFKTFLAEWNQVSKICGPKQDPTADGKFNYTPLCKWGNDEADKVTDNKKSSSFYFLAEEEMTFNKERHPDPVEHRHYLSFDNWDSAQNVLQSLALDKTSRQKSLTEAE